MSAKPSRSTVRAPKLAAKNGAARKAVAKKTAVTKKPAKKTAKKAPRSTAALLAGSATIHGIGVDLLQVERMEKLLARRGESLLPRLLMNEELAEVRARPRTARALAMCWAAKEAFAKALGSGFRVFGWRDVGVIREANGRPVLIYSRKLQALLKVQGIGHAHVSLSDDGGMACAYVVLERAR